MQKFGVLDTWYSGCRDKAVSSLGAADNLTCLLLAFGCHWGSPIGPSSDTRTVERKTDTYYNFRNLFDQKLISIGQNQTEVVRTTPLLGAGGKTNTEERWKRGKEISHSL